ncbi:MAG: hypothetical protein AAF950_17825 [Pseudomonadota bacterium]
MTQSEQNIALVEGLPKLIPDRLREASDVIAEDFQWHYLNPSLPVLNKTYVGIDG